MSLYKQLWLTISCLVVLTFGAVFLVSSLSARQYLEHQLYMKNVDNAAALALSVSYAESLGRLDPQVLQEQFDRGHYQFIELRDESGALLYEFRAPATEAGPPAWFQRMLPIEVAPGVAQLRAGDRVLTVSSQVAFAYQTLWDSTRRLAMIFLMVGVISGIAGTALLRVLLRPLQLVAEQATAIGERRFVTMPEPRSAELRAVSEAMNNLSRRVRGMLQKESSRLERWRNEAHVDEVTGLLNRQHFMNLFESTLSSDDAGAEGTLTLVRVTDLSVLNQIHGRDTIDSILTGFGAALARIREGNSGAAAGRLSGAEFALLMPGELDAGAIGNDLQRALREVLRESGLGDEVKLPGASTNYKLGDSAGELLSHLDSALLNSEQQGESDMVIMGRNGIQMMPVRQELKRWRSVLYCAFSQNLFSLASFPVIGFDGEQLHAEAPARLQWRDNVFSAGQFLPWINRLELADELDRAVIGLALLRAEKTGEPVSINLSGSAVANPSFLPWLSERLSARPEAAALLWMEVTESAAYRHLENFSRLCARCKRYGTRVGIEHLGHQLSDIGRLHDVGVDYVKVDSAFVRGVDDNPANQTLLRTLCTLVHSLGITAVAEGVESEAEWRALGELGFDAATGPAVTARYGEQVTREASPDEIEWRSPDLAAAF